MLVRACANMCFPYSTSVESNLKSYSFAARIKAPDMSMCRMNISYDRAFGWPVGG